jgi:hypothetical protein
MSRTRARHWVTLLACGLVLGALNACVAKQTKTIAFQGDSIPAKTGIIASIDIIFTAGTTQTGASYPREFPTTAPFIQFQVAEIGTIASYSLRIFPIEPGQKVTCLISINGLIVDRSASTYPKPAICSGPPV